MGSTSGDALTTGSDNTCIGFGADTDDATAINQSVIGHSATGQADNSVTLGNASVTDVYMANDVGARFTIGTGGAVTMPNQPAFLVQPASQQANPANNDTVAFGTEIFDQGGDFASNTFTAPVTGRYQLSFYIYSTSPFDTASNHMGFQLVTHNRTYEHIIDPDVFDSAGSYYPWTFSILADMDASDTAYIRFFEAGGTVTLDISTSSYFSGYLVC